METNGVHITPSQLQMLLSAGSADGALLYLYYAAGNHSPEQDLQFSETRLRSAQTLLRQLGLYSDPEPSPLLPGRPPRYTEQDVVSAMDGDGDFKVLFGEVQRLLGRALNTEELKILLGFRRYLGMSNDLIGVLVCYCKERSRQRSGRAPSLRTIEREAYAWAELHIETMEDAAAYIRRENLRQSRMGKLMQLLQLHGRKPTAAEEKYMSQWLSWGFDEESLKMAYEKTCLSTGKLTWAYMHGILKRWQEMGLTTAEKIRRGDRKSDAPKGAEGKLGKEELEAIRRTLQEE